MNHKRLFFVIVMLVTILSLAFGFGSSEQSSAEVADRANVDRQQLHYQDVHPLPFFEFSIPRSVYIQIYEVVTTQAFTTYTLIQSVTGVPIVYGPSIGYGIPADTSLTNPLQAGNYDGTESNSAYVLEQAEPNGLFSSKNTDGTWVLYVQPNGDITPIYTEQKVTTFPFHVTRTQSGLWVRADDEAVDFTIRVNGGSK